MEDELQALKMLLIFVLLMLALAVMTGCATKMEITEQRTETTETGTKLTKKDSVTATKTDSVLQHEATNTTSSTTTIVTPRKVETQVELPQESRESTTTFMIPQSGITKDTTMTLETKYYKSTVSWHTGRVTHTLETKPGATLPVTVQVADTTRTTTTKETANRTRREISNSSVEASSRTEKSDSMIKTLQQATQVKRKHHRWVAWAIPAGIAIAAALLYFILRAADIRRKS